MMFVVPAFISFISRTQGAGDVRTCVTHRKGLHTGFMWGELKRPRDGPGYKWKDNVSERNTVGMESLKEV
jgi:hypothetical protein